MYSPLLNIMSLPFPVSPIRVKPRRLLVDAAAVSRCTTTIVVLEHPAKPHNVGAAIRSCERLGVGKLYIVGGTGLSGHTCRELRRRNLALLGASTKIHLHRFETTAECMAHLTANGVTSFATGPVPTTPAKGDVFERATRPKRLAVWFGNEARGLSEEAKRWCVDTIAIEMYGFVESFNLAAATYAVMSFVTRARRSSCCRRLLRRRRRKAARVGGRTTQELRSAGISGGRAGAEERKEGV